MYGSKRNQLFFFFLEKVYAKQDKNQLFKLCISAC